MVSKCSKCEADIVFRKKIDYNAPLKDRKIVWNILNVNGTNHRDTCFKKNSKTSFSDPRNKLLFCKDCEDLNHFGGVFDSWEQWELHKGVSGHGCVRKWSIKDVDGSKTCQCIKFCYGKE